MTNSNPTILILCGGDSSEKEVSKASGKAVYEVLQKSTSTELLFLEENQLPENIDPSKHILFPLIHGAYGEDGKLSAELEAKGFVYAGSGPSASVICFDKCVTKAMALKLGIPTVEDWSGVILNPSHLRQIPLQGNRFICKPRAQGSSVGMFLYEKGSEELPDNLLPEEYLVEPFIEGRDLTVGVLNGTALGVVGINPKSELYDYDSKYTPGRTDYEVPAKVPENVAKDAQHYAQLIYAHCRCRDFARVDFRLSAEGQLYFLEVNTIPGMTATSLLPKSASIKGYSFIQLIDEMLKPASSRFSEKFY